MALTYTQHTLDKLELLLNALEYKVRYEKGNFKTGACVIENSRLVVVNKFSTVESKIYSLINLIQQIPVDVSLLQEKQLQFLKSLNQTVIQF